MYWARSRVHVVSCIKLHLCFVFEVGLGLSMWHWRSVVIRPRLSVWGLHVLCILVAYVVNSAPPIGRYRTDIRVGASWRGKQVLVILTEELQLSDNHSVPPTHSASSSKTERTFNILTAVKRKTVVFTHSMTSPVCPFEMSRITVYT